MDLLHLEHFLAVVDEGTFTRAAQRLNRTQPAISHSVRRLEEEVGAPLFLRGVREVALTEAGRVLAEHARRLLRMRDDAVRQVSDIRRLNAGGLTIAAHESAAVYLLPGPLRMYLRRFPSIKVAIQRSQLSEIPRLVMDREVDIGFVKDEPAFRELQWADVHADEMMLVASPRHALTQRSNVSIRDLGSEQFVLHHQCSATADRILQLFDQHGTRCRVVAELWSFENVKQFVREDVGLAFVPGVTVRQELADGALVRIPVRELSMPRRILMICREQGHVSDSASEFMKLMRAFHLESPAARANSTRDRSSVARRARRPPVVPHAGAKTPLH
jgi:DNA-binding transcriptional LysR family regulator